MKGSDISAHLTLSAKQGDAGKIVKLPLPKKKKNSDKVVKPSAKLRRGNLWYALYLPQLAELDDANQTQILNTLANLITSVSSTVGLHPQSLIFEIRSSLRYFGGINNIHEKLKNLVTPILQENTRTSYFLYAISPTISGSLLLARSGHNTLVHRKENLRSALGQLSTSVLQLNREQNRRLLNMGIRRIRDIWRLPAADLRKRFGSDFINLLNKALGSAPEPTSNYIPPPKFSASYDLHHELESVDQLLPIFEEMLAQLCEFLRKRDLSVNHLALSLLHEERSCTKMDIGLRQSSRCDKHLLLLIKTRFNNFCMPAPIIGLKVVAKKFDAFTSRSKDLLKRDHKINKHHNNINNGGMNEFMDQLQARLGNNALIGINPIAEHCPEYANQQSNYEEERTKVLADSVTANSRPFWLLEKPLRLVLNNGKLYHRQVIGIISGPERIETYWWSGKEVQRDYYIAREHCGSRIWIFRERVGERNWYLHGYFS